MTCKRPKDLKKSKKLYENWKNMYKMMIGGLKISRRWYLDLLLWLKVCLVRVKEEKLGFKSSKSQTLMIITCLYLIINLKIIYYTLVPLMNRYRLTALSTIRNKHLQSIPCPTCQILYKIIYQFNLKLKPVFQKWGQFPKNK